MASRFSTTKNNKKFKYILVVIDCFSKCMWAKPLKTKNAHEVSHAFTKILKEGRHPNNLETDNEKEFYNVAFKEGFQKYNINDYSTFSNKKKAPIVERSIRTIKEQLYKYFSLNGTYKWHDILPKIIENYNNRKQATIRMQPREVNKNNEKLLLKSAYDFKKIAGANKFKVGDIVRISKVKHVFSKGYLPSWSTELFKIK